MRALVLGLSLIGVSGIVVSGCAGWAPQATPREATMKSGTLTVAFSDGTRCSADTLAARSGVLTGCVWPMSYDVTYYHPSLAAGTPLAPLFQDYATVRLSRAGAGGAEVFLGPSGVEGVAPGTLVCGGGVFQVAFGGVCVDGRGDEVADGVDAFVGVCFDQLPCALCGVIGAQCRVAHATQNIFPRHVAPWQRRVLTCGRAFVGSAGCVKPLAEQAIDLGTLSHHTFGMGPRWVAGSLRWAEGMVTG